MIVVELRSRQLDRDRGYTRRLRLIHSAEKTDLVFGAAPRKSPKWPASVSSTPWFDPTRLAWNRCTVAVKRSFQICRSASPSCWCQYESICRPRNGLDRRLTSSAPVWFVPLAVAVGAAEDVESLIASGQLVAVPDQYVFLPDNFCIWHDDAHRVSAIHRAASPRPPQTTMAGRLSCPRAS